VQPVPSVTHKPLRVWPIMPRVFPSQLWGWTCRICDTYAMFYPFPGHAAEAAREHLSTKPHHVPTVCVGQTIGPVHWILLNLHRASQGLPPWHKQTGRPAWVTAAELNAAIDWWNASHSLTPPPALLEQAPA
jgi:hypothetical protein